MLGELPKFPSSILWFAPCTSSPLCNSRRLPTSVFPLKALFKKNQNRGNEPEGSLRDYYRLDPNVPISSLRVRFRATRRATLGSDHDPNLGRWVLLWYVECMTRTLDGGKMHRFLRPRYWRLKAVGAAADGCVKLRL